jgi:hypothetical protein
VPDSTDGYFDEELLTRFRPLLVYDRQYDYRATAVESMVENSGNLLRGFDDEVIATAGGNPQLSLELLSNYPAGRKGDPGDCICAAASRIPDARRMEHDYGPCAYGRIVERNGYRWLQYWFWFYDNPKNVRGIGRHEGDWEFIQIELDADDVPRRLTYSQHKRGESRDAARGVEFRRDGEEVNPVVYIAPLSHACYFERGTHVYLGGIDHPYGDGQRLPPSVREFGDWASWPGRWGNCEWAIGKEGRAPQSPGCQGDRWSEPALFHDSGAKGGRRLLGRFAHLLGTLTYPRRPPTITVAKTPEGVEVNYRLRAGGQHIYITLHSGEDVIRSRTIDKAKREDLVKFPMTSVPDDCVVRASTFNWFRQRSDLAQQRVT